MYIYVYISHLFPIYFPWMSASFGKMTVFRTPSQDRATKDLERIEYHLRASESSPKWPKISAIHSGRAWAKGRGVAQHFRC